MTQPRRRSAFVSKLMLSARAPSQDVILAELRRVILDGGAAPGAQIPLDDVAEFFGVSLIPVREALRTLIGEELVDHRQRSGYIVARLTFGVCARCEGRRRLQLVHRLRRRVRRLLPLLTKDGRHGHDEAGQRTRLRRHRPRELTDQRLTGEHPQPPVNRQPRARGCRCLGEAVGAPAGLLVEARCRGLPQW